MALKLVGLFPESDFKEHHDGRRPDDDPADVLAQAMSGEHGDWLRDAVALFAQQLMEAEIEQRTGAARGERSAAYVNRVSTRKVDRLVEHLGIGAMSKDRVSASAAGSCPRALVVAYAVNQDGVREVIGLDIGQVESGPFWVAFPRDLKARGLQGVQLAISDHHEGLKAAIAQVLAAPWQRCTVHFVRNMHGHCRA